MEIEKAQRIQRIYNWSRLLIILSLILLVIWKLCI